MASILTLSGTKRGLGQEGERCKCVRNPRTRRITKICFVGKSKKHRSGWKIVGICR